MPRFSVIVPVHQVQAYLPECLDSVLTQSFTDLELILVDDGSPPDCGELLADAAADPRVTVLRLPGPTGPGPARNAGLTYARGDYVLFLDSDDALTTGALQALAARLSETGEPDVLVFDHVRAFWHGGSDRGGGPLAPLAQREPQVFRLRDRPELLRLPTAVWNKVYRRHFLAARGLRLPPGAHEGVPWTWCTLLTAEAVTVLDRVCVVHRQRREGALLSGTTRRHFDVFGQYDRVFAFLDDHPELARWRPVLYRRMADHLAGLFLAPGRLPRAGRAEFFRRSSRLCLRHQSSAGRTNLAHVLVRLGARRTFSALWSLRALGRRLRAAGRSTRAAMLRLHHSVQCRRRLDPSLAVFLTHPADGRPVYDGDPAALEAKARELVPGLRTAWVADAAHAAELPPGVRRLQPGSAAYWSALARAKYLVSDGDFGARRHKRAGQVLLQTHQGTPLGRLGVELRDRSPRAARPARGDGMGAEAARLLERVEEWDYSLSANRHSTLAFERAYPGGYTTLEFGAPRNDVFFRATAEDVAGLRAELGVPPGVVAVLYAPAERDYLHGGAPPLELSRLASALGPGYVVLDGSAARRAAELCLAADALVTDYSPLMFDYAVLDRPIVVHAPDWETYRATRGSCLDLPNAAPGPVVRDLESLVACFREDLWRSARAAERRAAFRARFCPYDDGLAAERVVRSVFLDGARPAPVVPRELRRPVGVPGREDGARPVIHAARRGDGSSSPPPARASRA
ncbi:bifunctional glycosyltransferase/CDP-glycerol:glycerophosphate glycerophosphotransferase [Streptomyces alkaliterrae]|uniref:Glycosyltransferase n=2 Tax=Streptomyces alkaliterrae TaxID=2213162 RepID=A0A5P0YQ43_9ACTN|nr:bifunctional glycosyltransferase family 2 protein/CDP-glycerol:glycerophosphate glycerophosphotransferase [Streptomyces alkaliterrae]MBB1261381.1 bifunctional glycosyltransferase family 2 protein/CDP-glycerol:glycerophosphate glycerophosphotransferase [Streptomyces alkaliterrae]MQS00639.1 glycosyltransferase [Streptomyces alkaliterrae]